MVARWRAIVFFLLVCGAAGAAAPAACAFDRMYGASALAKDQPRLARAVQRIFNEGVRPVLTEPERRTFQAVEFRFPLPQPGDPALNFYAGRIGERPVAVMPVLSLKVLEDLTTAFSYLHHNAYHASTIDTYFAMLRHRPREAFAGDRYPPILEALGIPADALSNPAVDRMALSLRNEAFLFLLMHELGHLHLGHLGYADVTKARARADEAAADAFALDIMVRTKTPPMGAMLFFKAQAYSLLNRGEFESDEAFERYLDTSSTHPLTVHRLSALVGVMRQRLVQVRPDERAIWLFIAAELSNIIEILSDTDLQRCMTAVARQAPLASLRPRRDVDRASMQRFCGKR